MSDQNSSLDQSQQKQLALLRVLKATMTLPAQMTLYAYTLVAIFLMIGTANLPVALTAIVTGVGINLLSSLLERIAQGDEVSDEEVLQTVLAAIEESRIQDRLSNNDTQRMIGRLFRETDLIRYAVKDSELNIIRKLEELNIPELGILLAELHDQIQQLLPSRAFLTYQEFIERREHYALATYQNDLIGREVILSQLKADLATPLRLIILHGPGGVGKTRLVLALPGIVDEKTDLWYVRTEAESVDRDMTSLDNNRKHVIVVDDAHRFEPLSHLREVLVNPNLANKVTLILLTRSVFKENIIYQLGAGSIPRDQIREIEVEPLRNAEIDQLLQNQPYLITDTDICYTLITLAEGNPLFASLGAQLVQRNIAVVQLTRDEVLTRYLNEVIHDLAEAGHDDRYIGYLQILAALDTFNLDDQILGEKVRQVINISSVEEERIVSRLEEAGLIERYWKTLEISSEILVDHILVYHFFNPETRRANYQEQIIDPFFELKPKEILSNLAKAEVKGESSKAGLLLGNKLAELQQIAVNGGIVIRFNILSCLGNVAYLRPDDILMIIAAIVDGPEEPPETVQHPLWGVRNVHHKLVLDKAIDLLAQTIYRGELRDTIIYLHKLSVYRLDIEEYQAIREKAKQALIEIAKFKPNKPFNVQAILLELVTNWLQQDFANNLDVTLAVLQPMLAIEFGSVERDPNTPFTIIEYRGLLPPVEPLCRIREVVVENLKQAYQLTLNISERIKIIKAFNQVLPYYLSGKELPPEIWEPLKVDCMTTVRFFTEVVFPQAEYPIFDVISDWLWRIHHFTPFWAEEYEQLGLQLTGHPEYQIYCLLIGSSLRRDKLDGQRLDWRTSEERHRQAIDNFLNSFSPEIFVETINTLERIITQAQAVGTGVYWFNILLHNLGERHPDLACQFIEKAVTENLTLKHYLGPIIGGLHDSVPSIAQGYIESWLAANDPIFLLVAVQSYRSVKSNELRGQDWEVLELLVGRENSQVDHEVIGLISRFGVSEPNTAVKLLKSLATRGDKKILLHIAEVLAWQVETGQEQQTIEFTNAQDFLDIVQNFAMVAISR